MVLSRFFFVSAHCHSVSSMYRQAVKTGVLILCIVAAISILMAFSKPSSFDNTAFNYQGSTAVSGQTALSINSCLMERSNNILQFQKLVEERFFYVFESGGKYGLWNLQLTGLRVSQEIKAFILNLAKRALRTKRSMLQSCLIDGAPLAVSQRFSPDSGDSEEGIVAVGLVTGT